MDEKKEKEEEDDNSTNFHTIKIYYIKWSGWRCSEIEKIPGSANALNQFIIQ